MSNHFTLEQDSMVRNARLVRIATIATFIVLMLITALMLLWTPLTGPWSQERIGMANLRQAKQERKIEIEIALGELTAAEASAQAMRNMGQAARDFPEYRTQIFVSAFTQALKAGTIGEIIYLPMEAALPVSEAGRMVPK